VLKEIAGLESVRKTEGADVTSQVSSEPPAVAVKRLRVLFVEDSPVDLELCLR
jgi:hypothetical protein